MTEEICCIINKGKTAKNEWKNDEPNFLLASSFILLAKN